MQEISQTGYDSIFAARRGIVGVSHTPGEGYMTVEGETPGEGLTLDSREGLPFGNLRGSCDVDVSGFASEKHDYANFQL